MVRSFESSKSLMGTPHPTVIIHPGHYCVPTQTTHFMVFFSRLSVTLLCLLVCSLTVSHVHTPRQYASSSCKPFLPSLRVCFTLLCCKLSGRGTIPVKSSCCKLSGRGTIPVRVVSFLAEAPYQLLGARACAGFCR